MKETASFTQCFSIPIPEDDNVAWPRTDNKFVVIVGPLRPHSGIGVMR
jgi:hypothetical protein